MAIKIPTLEGPSVAARALDAPMANYDTRGAFGDQIAQALRGAAETSGKIAGELRQEEKQRKDRNDTAAMAAAEASFDAATQEKLYTGKDPYLETQGTNAIGRREVTEADLEKTRQTIKTSLPDERLQQLFELRSQNSLLRAKHDIGSHYNKQSDVVADSSAAAKLATALRDQTIHYNDENLYQQNLRGGLSAAPEAPVVPPETGIPTGGGGDLNDPVPGAPAAAQPQTPGMDPTRGQATAVALSDPSPGRSPLGANAPRPSVPEGASQLDYVKADARRKGYAPEVAKAVEDDYRSQVAEARLKGFLTPRKDPVTGRERIDARGAKAFFETSRDTLGKRGDQYAARIAEEGLRADAQDASAAIRKAAQDPNKGGRWVDAQAMTDAVEQISNDDPIKPHVAALVEHAISLNEHEQSKAARAAAARANAAYEKGGHVLTAVDAADKTYLLDPNNGLEGVGLWQSLEARAEQQLAARRTKTKPEADSEAQKTALLGLQRDMLEDPSKYLDMDAPTFRSMAAKAGLSLKGLDKVSEDLVGLTKGSVGGDPSATLNADVNRAIIETMTENMPTAMRKTGEFDPRKPATFGLGQTQLGQNIGSIYEAVQDKLKTLRNNNRTGGAKTGAADFKAEAAKALAKVRVEKPRWFGLLGTKTIETTLIDAERAGLPFQTVDAAPSKKAPSGDVNLDAAPAPAPVGEFNMADPLAPKAPSPLLAPAAQAWRPVARVEDIPTPIRAAIERAISESDSFRLRSFTPTDVVRIYNRGGATRALGALTPPAATAPAKKQADAVATEAIKASFVSAPIAAAKAVAEAAAKAAAGAKETVLDAPTRKAVDALASAATRKPDEPSTPASGPGQVVDAVARVGGLLWGK